MRETRIPFMQSLIGKVLDGSKTVTRRPMRQMLCEGEGGPGRARLLRCENGIATFGDSIPDDPCPIDVKCPYGGPGDILLPTETWATSRVMDDIPPRLLSNYMLTENAVRVLFYRARPEPPEWRTERIRGRWRPPMFMPKWASRGRLEILSVRAERVQDITEEDAKAEGVEPFPYDPEGDCWTDGKYRTAFEYTWNELHGWNPNAWDRNDWLWRLEFRRLDPAGRPVR